MKGVNLSEWALKHQQMVLFLIMLLGLAGVFAYQQLGQKEDPEFTFKSMVVQTTWPGATARDVADQLTDKLEKKLQEVAEIDYTKSYSRPGESQITVNLREDTPAQQVPDVWYQIRKKVNDIAHTLPEGVRGPFFNDEFGDTYGNIYAITGDGLRRGGFSRGSRSRPSWALQGVLAGSGTGIKDEVPAPAGYRARNRHEIVRAQQPVPEVLLGGAEGARI